MFFKKSLLFYPQNYFPKSFAETKSISTFAAVFDNNLRDVVQLVVCLVWDQEVARSSRVIPTKNNRKNSVNHH